MTVITSTAPVVTASTASRASTTSRKSTKSTSPSKRSSSSSSPSKRSSASSRASSSSSTASIERLREQILYHVDKILLQSPPSRQSLYNLLKLCNPDLPLSSLDSPVLREKAFRSVKARLHPDKHHAHEQQRVTLLFQNVQQYYVECCHAMADEHASRYRKASTMVNGGVPHRSSSTGSTRQPTTRPSYTRRSTFGNDRTSSPPSQSTSSIPLEHDSFAKWPFLKQIPRDTPFQAVSTSSLYYHLAYACLNYRGAICHGQAMDCTYQVPVNLIETTTSPKSIPAVWTEAGFAPDQTLTLNSVEQIKRELYHHGPVVSTSFGLDPTYYQSARHAGNFSERHVGTCHPLLLVGWTMTSQGEVWLAQGLRGPTFGIGMGQFQIDAHAIAPSTQLLQQKSWQSPGPFWGVPNMSDKCQAWKEKFECANCLTCASPLGLLEIQPLTSGDVENLADLFHVGLHAVIMERRIFVLRDKIKQAHSRRVLLRDVARVPHVDSATGATKKVWKVTVSVVRK